MAGLLYLFQTHTVAAVLYGLLALWLIIDCVRNGETYWIWIILVFPYAGAIAYLILNKFPDWQVTERLNRIFFGGHRIRELKAKIHHMNLPYHWVQLGNEYRGDKKWQPAAEAYGKALEFEPGNEEARYGMGVAQYELGRPQASLELLYPLIEKNVRYEHGTALMVAARAYEKLGLSAEARQMFELALQFYAYPQLQFEYARLLVGMGEIGRGRELLQRLSDDGRNATGFKMREERRWGRRARLLLSRAAA